MQRRNPSAALTAGIILAGFVFSLAMNWPGHLSYDSVMQLWEGRTGLYNNWHPPVMAWLLGSFDGLHPGTGLFTAFDAALAFGSFFALAGLWARPSWAAPAVAAAAVSMPQLLLYQGIVWKDVLFADAGLAGFAGLAWAAEIWPRASLRYGLLAASAGLLALAALARQNGALLILGAALSLGWIASLHAERNRLRIAGVYGGAFFIGALAIVAASTAALDTRLAIGGGAAKQIEELQAYDLIGALKANPGLRFPAIENKDPLLDRMMRTKGIAFYNPERRDTLLKSPALQSALLNAKFGVVAQGWYDLVLHHPWTYLRVRAEIFRWVFLTPDLALCVPYIVGVNGPPDEMRHLGLATRFDTRDEALNDYAARFMGTPVFSHVAWAVIALGAFILLLRRRKPADIAIAGMLGGALVCTASFFVISIACDYRYLYGLDLAALAAVFYLSLNPFGFARRRDAALESQRPAV